LEELDIDLHIEYKLSPAQCKLAGHTNEFLFVTHLIMAREK